MGSHRDTAEGLTAAGVAPWEATDNVGQVEARSLRVTLPAEGLRLESGQALLQLDMAYETYGTLAPKGDNAIFICPTLTSDAHVAGYHGTDPDTCGWWDELIGPGKGIDTRYYFVVCANTLGGCKGTTGPASADPATGRPYGSRFPHFTVGDVVEAHWLFLQQLGVKRLAAVVGGSYGGMQALEWAVRFPDVVERCICIASAASLSAQALAFDIIGRNAIMADRFWQGGDYYGTGRTPDRGLALARKIGHITYLSQEMMDQKFGREKRARRATGTGRDAKPRAPSFLSDFQVESYLEHQGEKFVKRFDANSYLHIIRAIDEYDLAARYGSLEKAFDRVKARVLVVALSSDWLFPPEQSIELANGLLRSRKRVSYCELDAPHGHDAFLVDIGELSRVVRAFLPWIDVAEDEGKNGCCGQPGSAKCQEYRIIRRMVKPGGRVLDLGTGTGDLLSLLAKENQVSGTGVDIDLANVIEVIDKGHDIFQGDIDRGLATVPDGSYDYAILNQTLQVVKRPRFVLQEMLRVAPEGIVSFPNFGAWSNRLYLNWHGRMPKSRTLPFEWYDTPNIHLFTLKDFVEMCRVDGIEVKELVAIPDSGLSRLALALFGRNVGADRVVARIARRG